jgi:hypothetical protein
MKWNLETMSPRGLAAVLQIRATAFPLAAGELHVSPEGDDANPGTAAKPLATLERWPDFKTGAHGVDAGYSKGLAPVAGVPFSKVDPP